MVQTSSVPLFISCYWCRSCPDPSFKEFADLGKQVRVF
jgi:hypothetical protein